MMLIFKGCTTDDLSNESDSLDQNIQALTTRTTVAITKCVDAYVNIGGYEEYNGTHCWTEYYETGGGGSGGALSGDEYYPDSYPASEGGSSWVPGTSQQFNYSNLNKLYAPGSTTNLAFKENLNEILGQFIQRGDSYASVFDLLIESHAKIKFVINPNIEYEALYDKNCETIFSKDISFISLFAFSEELLHAAQYQCFYGNTMDMQYKNFEFEVKVFYDIARNFDDNPLGVDYLPCFTDRRESFRIEYKTWIDGVFAAKRFFRAIHRTLMKCVICGVVMTIRDHVCQHLLPSL